MAFGSPDRVPISFGCSGRALLRHGEALLEIVRRYRHDFFPQQCVKTPPARRSSTGERVRNNLPGESS